MDKVLNLYKKRGETPLECIHRFKMLHGEYASTGMTYAGRLDPLAEGVLLVLSGLYVHEKSKYTELKKEYEVEVLFGVGTDTYDVLGLVTGFSEKDCDTFTAEEKLKTFVGRHIFSYPPYSSKPVLGKPLFMWARSGEILPEDAIPKKEVEIYSADCESWSEISAKELLTKVEEAIGSVHGDFRQEVSVSQWQKTLANSDAVFSVARIRVACSSGTYMRSLAKKWGETLGLPALAYSILRTKVGYFGIEESIRD